MSYSLLFLGDFGGTDLHSVPKTGDLWITGMAHSFAINIVGPEPMGWAVNTNLLQS
jgi:hypothetical protein